MFAASNLKPRILAFAAIALAACVLGLAGTDARAATTLVYAGTTSGDQYPIVLKLRGSRVVGIATMFRAPCTSGRYYSFGRELRLRNGPAVRKGRVTISLSFPESLGSGAEATVTLKLTGSVKGSTMTGSFSGGVAVGPGESCTLAPQRFTLAHRHGLVYGGVTSEDLPVVLELAGSRTAIKHLHIGWYAPCASGGGIQFPDFLTGGAVRGGAFGGSFGFDQDSGDGGSVRLDYVISGNVTRTAGSGRLKVTVTERDAAGAVTDTCTTPAITFRLSG